MECIEAKVKHTQVTLPKHANEFDSLACVIACDKNYEDRYGEGYEDEY
jgi:hypothetical protein